MKIISIEAKNIKSIPEKCDRLTFFKHNDKKEKPVSTLILGGNGTSKSTFLEALAMLSHTNIMAVCNRNPIEKSESYIKVKVCLPGSKHIGVLIFSAVEHIDPELIDPKTKTFDIDKVKFSAKKAGLLSSHIVDEHLIKQHWCVFYVADDSKSFKAHYKNLLDYNRPPAPIPTEGKNNLDLNERIKIAGDHNRENNKRAKKLFEFDKLLAEAVDKDTKKKLQARLKEELIAKGTLAMVNTDMNAYGVGLNIFESPKNLKSDVPQVIHYRLACTDENGSLRNLDKLQEYWSRIFHYRKIEHVVCEENDKGIYEARFKIKNQFGKDIDNLETFSSGENEVFFVLATVLCLELYNSVLLLDEPELHMSMEQLQSYYEILFELAANYNLQLIFSTHQPFVAEYLVEENTSNRETIKKLKQVEMRLLKPNGLTNELSIEHDKKNIKIHFFENEIVRYIGRAYWKWGFEVPEAIKKPLSNEDKTWLIKQKDKIEALLE